MVKSKKDERIKNDLQDILQKTKDRATRTQLRTAGELRCFGTASSFCSTCDTCRKDEPNIVLRGNRSGHKNTEIKTHPIPEEGEA